MCVYSYVMLFQYRVNHISRLEILIYFWQLTFFTESLNTVDGGGEIFAYMLCIGILGHFNKWCRCVFQTQTLVGTRFLWHMESNRCRQFISFVDGIYLPHYTGVAYISARSRIYAHQSHHLLFATVQNILCKQLFGSKGWVFCTYFGSHLLLSIDIDHWLLIRLKNDHLSIFSYYDYANGKYVFDFCYAW